MSRYRKEIGRICATVVLLLAAVLITEHFSMPWYGNLAVFLAVYLLIGYDVVLGALGGIGRGQVFDENFLMVVATIGAFATSQYPEAVSVMLLYQIGELFQRYAVGKSRGSISQLMELCPEEARILVDGQEQDVFPEEVQVGQTLVVKPGERVALDGIIRKGTSSLDTSALTGESVPRDCGPGDEILSGVIVSSGRLEIEVTKEFENSTVSQILEMVENAAEKKAKTERFITRFAKYYTPTVVVLALVLAIVPPLFNGDWVSAVRKAMNFLVVSCPCALVISVPMSFFCGIGAASKKGILVKGGAELEQLAQTKTFVFDKTGTLTKGSFEVVSVLPENRRREVLEAAALAEHGSLHPIARSILAAAGEPKERDWTITETAGHGVSAQKNGTEILVGNQRMLESQGIAVENTEVLGTAVHVAKNGKYLGTLVISDVLKEDAAQAIRQLNRQGARTVMLTGDRQIAAQAIANEVGIQEFHADLLPGDKVHQVEELLQKKQKNETLAFVGDGINDAPVLVRADVGIAMGAIGSDAAIEAADVVLMRDQLSAIPVAQSIAKKTIRIVYENIWFALLVKFVVLAMTPFNLVSIWLAIFSDVGVAVLAILNAMRAGSVDSKSTGRDGQIRQSGQVAQGF